MECSSARRRLAVKRSRLEASRRLARPPRSTGDVLKAAPRSDMASTRDTHEADAVVSRIESKRNDIRHRRRRALWQLDTTCGLETE